jgi:hypothetical protein
VVLGHVGMAWRAIRHTGVLGVNPLRTLGMFLWCYWRFGASLYTLAAWAAWRYSSQTALNDGERRLSYAALLEETN